MIYKVGLLGGAGKMGIEVAAILGQGLKAGKDYYELADVVDESDRFSAIEGVTVRKLADPPREPVHLWIDFSRPEATIKLLNQINEPIVIATTGFSESQHKRILAYGEKHPVLLASNMSVGMNLMMGLLKQLPDPKGLPFDIALTEEHHIHKKDAPSGTAKTLIEILKKRGFEEVPCSVVRAGGIRGVHTVKLVGEDEIVEIRHEALDRKIFANGALVAAFFLVKQKKPGLYTMADALASGSEK